MRPFCSFFGLLVSLASCAQAWSQAPPELIFVEKPAGLVANSEKLLLALSQYKVTPPASTIRSLQRAIQAKDAEAIQEALDPQTLLVVTINPEGRAKVARGPGQLVLVRNAPGYAIIKVVNQSGGQQRLRAKGNYAGSKDSPFTLAVANHPKLPPDLSGELVEYRLLQVSCRSAGKHEITIGFDAGQGTQDLGFRGEAPVLFDVRPES